MYPEYLMHYGVKGMKWRHHNKRPQHTNTRRYLVTRKMDGQSKTSNLGVSNNFSLTTSQAFPDRVNIETDEGFASFPAKNFENHLHTHVGSSGKLDSKEIENYSHYIFSYPDVNVEKIKTNLSKRGCFIVAVDKITKKKKDKGKNFINKILSSLFKGKNSK